MSKDLRCTWLHALLGKIFNFASHDFSNSVSSRLLFLFINLQLITRQTFNWIYGSILTKTSSLFCRPCVREWNFWVYIYSCRGWIKSATYSCTYVPFTIFALWVASWVNSWLIPLFTLKMENVNLSKFFSFIYIYIFSLWCFVLDTKISEDHHSVARNFCVHVILVAV